MRTALWLALGFVAAWLVSGLVRPDPAPDSRVPELQAAVDSARREVRDARAERDSIERALADSTEAWEQRRGNLLAIASKARSYADSIADRLSDRWAGDSVATGLVEELRAAHLVEIEAISADRDSWKAEALALRSARETDARLIAAQADQIERHEALDAERVRINEALRAQMASQSRRVWIERVVWAGALVWAVR